MGFRFGIVNPDRFCGDLTTFEVNFPIQNSDCSLDSV